MFRLAKYLKNFKKEVILGPIFKLIEAIFELIVPLVMAKIIDVGIKNNDLPYIFKMGGIMILLGVFGLGFSLLCQYLASKASQGFGTVLRNDIFKHINSFSHAEIDKFGSSSLITRITNDVNHLQLSVAMLIRLVVRAPFLVIGSIIMAASLDYRLAIIFLAIIPIVGLVLYIIMNKSIPFYKIIQNKLDRIAQITKENLGGIRVIRAFSKENDERQRFNEAASDHMETSIKVGKLSALLNPLTYIILNFGILALIWFGGIQVNNGFLSQGEVIALVNYMSQILLALVVVANLVVIFTKASSCASRVNEIFDSESSIKGGEISEFSNDISIPIIEFKDIFFSYMKNDEYAVKGVSIKIFKGETVGIIGATGSGKSSLVNLIPRFYDVDKGKILIMGINSKNYTIAALRSIIGIVPQNAVLFSGTLAENLKWGCKDASDESMKAAVKSSQSEEFVEKLPDGYETIVREGGKNFSGGQKQRLTIARALISKPAILILDDSSSALDFATEAALKKSLREQTTGMTTIIISQRASSIQHADQIFVMDNGVMVGTGSHEDLLKRCTVYEEICSSQML